MIQQRRASAATARFSVRIRDTLATRFDPRANSLNAVRLGLAVLVLVSHAWPLNGWAWEPALGGLTLGGWAVVGFFGVSGFLITRSRLVSRSALRYYRARFLRIVPAFVVCLLVVAFLFSPITSALRGSRWEASSAITYVLRNLPLYPPYLLQPSVGDTLKGLPFPVWNGPLWTLFWEVACYVLVGTAASLLSARLLRVVFPLLAAGITVVTVVHSFGAIGVPWFLEGILPAVLAFCVGAVLFLYRDQVPVGTPAAVVVGLALAAAIVSDTARLAVPVLLPFLLLAAGCSRTLRAVGSRRDVSYGIYIYAWPVQQLLVVTFGERLPVPVAITATSAVTAVFALLSCVLVEQPALRWKTKPSPDRARPRAVVAPRSQDEGVVTASGRYPSSAPTATAELTASGIGR